jgi:hypothetical protein
MLDPLSKNSGQLWNMAATKFAVLNLRLLGRNNDSFR